MHGLLAAAECVIFDFDGPVCALFAGYPASGIAESLVDLLEQRGAPRLLPEQTRHSRDPLEILKVLAEVAPASPLVRNMEEWLTVEELKAAVSATPTLGAASLIRELRGRDRKLAVASNNSPRALKTYLARHDLLAYFEPHIHGRTFDPALLKPHPDSICRALKSTGTEPDRTLMIGDTPADVIAAGQAGVPFLGYARNRRKEDLLLRSGASDVVGAISEVLAALRAVTGGD